MEDKPQPRQIDREKLRQWFNDTVATASMHGDNPALTSEVREINRTVAEGFTLAIYKLNNGHFDFDAPASTPGDLRQRIRDALINDATANPDKYPVVVEVATGPVWDKHPTPELFHRCAEIAASVLNQQPAPADAAVERVNEAWAEFNQAANSMAPGLFDLELISAIERLEQAIAALDGRDSVRLHQSVGIRSDHCFFCWLKTDYWDAMPRCPYVPSKARAEQSK